ncbi:MAG: VOC family protein [Euryarchaeota archaeon]|nr:VOC family protein [Euryarchaeota archaeon]
MSSKTSVFLNVIDIDRSIRFYEGLGFTTVKKHPSRNGKYTAYADLELDGAELSLGHIPSNDERSFREWVATPLGAGVVVYFSVPDAEKHHHLAKKIGATIEAPLEKRSYGTAFTMNDPDGYTITFLQE